MSLDSYSGLLASLAGWLMRDDLAAVLPDFVTLAEADMSHRLRLRAMLTTASVSAAGGTLPADCVAVKSVTLDGTGPLGFASVAENATLAETYRGGPPAWWGIDGDKLVVSPTQASGTVALRYYARVPALSGGNPTNAILQASPALYLYGSLIQASPYLMDDARVQVWVTLYQEAANLLQAADDSAEYPGPLAIRPVAW